MGPECLSWQRAILVDLVHFKRGFDITKADQRDGPYPVVSSSGIKSHHSEAKVPRGGIVIGRKGTLGTVHFIDGPHWPHDTTLWVTDFKGNDPRYAYYALKTLQLERFDVGSSNPTLNRNHIHTIEIEIPPLLTQRRIAGILSAYDDLIENNTKRIEILEEMARALYREWFVHFRFPGHEKVKLVDSPLGQIPEGWEVGQLGDLLTLQRGFDLPKKQRIPGTVPIISSSGASGLHNVAKVAPPAVVTGRYGTLGKVFVVLEDSWPLNTTLFVKDFKGNSPYYCSHLLLSLDLARQMWRERCLV